jgi:hypothetical protein
MLARRVQIRRSFVILSPLVSDWICTLKGLNRDLADEIQDTNLKVEDHSDY